MKIYVTAAHHSPTGRVFSEVTKLEEVENHRLELDPVLSQTTSQHLSKLRTWFLMAGTVLPHWQCTLIDS